MNINLIVGFSLKILAGLWMLVAAVLLSIRLVRDNRKTAGRRDQECLPRGKNPDELIRDVEASRTSGYRQSLVLQRIRTSVKSLATLKAAWNDPPGKKFVDDFLESEPFFSVMPRRGREKKRDMHFNERLAIVVRILETELGKRGEYSDE